MAKDLTGFPGCLEEGHAGGGRLFARGDLFEIAHAARPGRPRGGSSQFDSCGFVVVAAVALEGEIIDAGSDGFDAGEHHLATTLRTRRPVDGWKPKKNKLGMEHGSSRNGWERDCSLGDRRPHRAALGEAQATTAFAANLVKSDHI